jgi:hypothetical protein
MTNDNDPKKRDAQMPAPANDNQVPASTDKNVFEVYADGVDNRRILGMLLKYVKGDYLIGRDSEECPEKELVAIVPGLVHGWIRWEDNRPVEQVMGLLIEGFVPPERNALGHLDKAGWELDAGGEPRDPWQQGLYLPMVTADSKTVYTFTTSSDGGRRRAVAPLCREYGHRIRQYPSELPVVRLEQDSYVHSERSIGRVKHPLFPVDRYVEGKPYLDAVAAIAGRPLNLLPGMAA